MRSRRSTALVILGVALLVLPSLASALTAPAIGSDSANGSPAAVSYEGRPDGRVSQYAANGSVVWNHTPARSYLAVQVLGDDSVFYTWKRINRNDCGTFDPPCARTGFTVYNRSTESVARRWSYPVRTGGNSEIHDAEYLGDGRVLVAGMDRERVFMLNGENEITWQWNASSFYEPPADATTRDWLHINDVDRIGEGRYLISVRNANQLLVISRGEGVTQVINKDHGGDDERCTANGDLVDSDGDGDVTCGDPSVISGQHNPHWIDNTTVLVADSLNNRVVELNKAPDGNWTPGWTVTAANGVPFDWPRDADRLPNGDTVITDSLNDRVVVVSPNGSVVWSLATPGLPYEGDVLPYGEPPASAVEPAGAELAADGGSGNVPFLYRARNGLAHVAPVPYWFGDLHLLAAVVGLLLVLAGGGLEATRRLAPAIRGRG